MDSPIDHPFAQRHIGPDDAERRAMLRELGYDSLDALIDAVVPPMIRRQRPMALPPARSEAQTLEALRRIAQTNRVFRSYIGTGYYGTFTPSVIRRGVLENPAWYTAYTPYQPEDLRQGRLEALLNFQTMVGELTALPVANASLLDEATAAAEAMALARRRVAGGRGRFVVSAGCHPQTIAVTLRTRAECTGVEVVVGDDPDSLDARTFGILLQYPSSLGAIVDHRPLIARAHETGALAIVAADPLALALLTPPGELGADLAVGSTQRFGMPLGYGGPHAAYLACRDELKRAIPGRLVGVSVDRHGATAYRLALQTREQPIRRERATSNICTAQVLPAIIAAMYAVYHGPDGLTAIARRVHERAVVLATGLRRLGWTLGDAPFFDTLVVAAGERSALVHARATAAGVDLRHVDARSVGISVDETTTPSDVERLWGVFAEERRRAVVRRAGADRAPAHRGEHAPRR